MRDGKNGNINLNMPREQRTQWRNYKNVYFFISGFRIGSQQRQSPVGTMRLNRMNKSIGIYSNNFARGFRDAIHVFSIRCVFCVGRCERTDNSVHFMKFEIYDDQRSAGLAFYEF